MAVDATVLIPWLRGDASSRQAEPLIAAMAPEVALELASALDGGATAMISQDPRLLASLPPPAHPPLS